ncbi:MBL fold metallo-hydrolase [Paenibacillus segetis]|uniref:MBL fold hydrolase n=1 Tax=Paenibacillus segetis TaxID=1325360 RepID=A0ABQ1Y274_9BACL|nr:MBL fold metallo-hydrolase [Paenibacillus segetis]GGH10233.1 MBL fold hydrolase [Paenibacillus segetis]
MELKKINDSIYYLEHVRETDRPVLGYVLGENFSIMIDCGNSKAHFDTFIKCLDDHDLPRPKYALITHWHWDHTFGMHAFAGDTIVSSLTNDKLQQLKSWSWDEESVLKRIETKEEIEFAYQCMKEEYDSFEEISVTTGTIIFENTLTLDLGWTTCQMMKVGGPHEEDSCIVYVQEAGILFAGDAHSGDYYHGEGKMDPIKMKEYIAFLEGTSFTTYIPGHGAPMSKEQVIQLLSKFCAEE